MMRTIDADSLMPLFMEKANTMNDRHGVKLGEEWLLNYNDIKDVIDNAPTADIQPELTIARSQGYERGFAEGYEEGFAKGKETPIDDLSEYSDKLWQKAYERGKAEARPQGEWILISERLPDYMDDILITFQKPNREPVVYRAVFIGSKFALDNGDVWNWNDPEIKAWTPLPEAYKEAENEDSN